MSEKYEARSINAIPSIQRWVWYSELLFFMQMLSICINTKTGLIWGLECAESIKKIQELRLNKSVLYNLLYYTENRRVIADSYYSLSIAFKFMRRGLWIVPLSLTRAEITVGKTSSVFKWLKRGWTPNGSVLKWYLNSRQLDHFNTGQIDSILFLYSYILVRYSNGQFSTLDQAWENFSI